MSIAFSWTACFSSRQSVATMLVAVGRPVARRNSAMNLAAGEALLRSARVLRVRQHMLCLPLQSRIASSSDHAPFGSSVMRACGKRSASAVTVSISCAPASTPPLSLKSLKSVARVRSLGQSQHGIGRQRLLMRSRSHSSLCIRLAAIRQVRLLPVADKKQVAEYIDAGALLTFAQKRRDRQREKLAEQIEQRRLDRRQRMHRGAQIEGL